jgi:hypothetical protein
VFVSGLKRQTWQSPEHNWALATHTPVFAQNPQSPKHFSWSISQKPLVHVWHSPGHGVCSLQGTPQAPSTQIWPVGQDSSRSVHMPVFVSGLNRQTRQSPVQSWALATQTPVFAQKPQSPKHFSWSTSQKPSTQV